MPALRNLPRPECDSSGLLALRRAVRVRGRRYPDGYLGHLAWRPPSRYHARTLCKGSAMRRIILLLGLSSTAFAPLPPRRLSPQEADLKAIQGVWVVESF